LRQEDALGIEKLNTVLPVTDMVAGVAYWSEILGVEATFVDGDRWAQFDVGATRLALAGRTEAGEPAVLAKVADLDAELSRISAAREVEIERDDGTHESRATLRDPDGNVLVLYQPKQSL
jgi:catechol 2,3-dioxygenase-like lactoylglutathione lyase family enzyme